MRVIELYKLHDTVTAANITVTNTKRGAGNSFYTGDNMRGHNMFVYIVSGALEVYEKKSGFSAEFKPGALIYLPCGSYYGSRYMEVDNEVVTVGCRLLDSSGEFILDEWLIEYPAERSGEYGELFRRMTEQNEDAAALLLRRTELMFAILRLCLSGSDERMRELGYSILLPALDEIKKRYAEKLSIAEFAKNAYISEGYLRKLCRRYIGCTPIEYRNRLRVQRARELLQSGQCDMSGAAEAVGFSDAGYFAKLLKRSIG